MEVQGAETLAQRFQLQALGVTPNDLTGYEGFASGDFTFDFEIDQVETWFTRNGASLEETKVEPDVNFNTDSEIPFLGSEDTIKFNDEVRDSTTSGFAIISFLLTTVLILLFARKRCQKQERDFERA